MPSSNRLLCLCLLLLNWIAVSSQGTMGLSQVKTTAGLVSGYRSQTGDISIFKGVPYAAPPVGNLRWKAPQPAPSWAGVRNCAEFSASPMQNSPVPFGPWTAEYLIPKAPINEDCLYLNIWTGAKSPGEKRPVMVWIYGGGFSSGGAAVPVYDGEALAKKGVVLVSINYRVGIFGFLAHPALSAESGHHRSGNYGLMDQIAALQWVKANISAFGGDPGRVTIFGQSAGSMSVNCLVASPLAKNLFQRAIAESGANFINGGFPVPNLQQAEKDGEALAAQFNAKDLEALRAIPAAELLAKAKMGARPIVDGYVLPQTIAEIFAAGKQNDVPLLTGWNEDDAVIFGKPKTAAEFTKQIQNQYGDDADKCLQFYPSGTDQQAAVSQAKSSRDMIFGMQNYTWAKTQVSTGKSKVFLYRFTRKVPATGDYVRFGAFHTGEVAYVFNNLNFVLNRPFVQIDNALAQTMSSYWVNFAATGNPNAQGLPDWPSFDQQKSMTMILGDTQYSAPLPDKEALDFICMHWQKKK